MSSNLNILKWLFSLVLIFGGFTLYKIFGVLAVDLGDKEYVWLVEIIPEFGLFTSVVISVGFFHHWIIATEERRETEKIFLGRMPYLHWQSELKNDSCYFSNRSSGTYRIFFWIIFTGTG